MIITKMMIITARITSTTHPPAAMTSAIPSTVAATAFAAAGGGPSVPWSSHRADVKTIIIESGVTSIGNEAFVAFFNLESATIADTVTRVGEQAFYNCTKLSCVNFQFCAR